MSVSPRSRMRGMAIASSDRAVTRIVWVCEVGRERVCERVARAKSSKRSRNTIVRASRSPLRSRPATRSHRASSMAPSSDSGRARRPNARCEPIDLRLRPVWTGRGSRWWASAWMCRPAPGPRIDTTAASGRPATSPTVPMPRSCSLPAVIGPTPQRRSTGSGWRKASSSPTGTCRSPSGLATALATLARNFELATPTVIGSPTSSRTRWRRSRAISTGSPDTLRRPPTSRNASSIEMPSTIGVVRENTSNTARLASV